jgi:hypothetical protein
MRWRRRGVTLERRNATRSAYASDDDALDPAAPPLVPTA